MRSRILKIRRWENKICLNQTEKIVEILGKKTRETSEITVEVSGTPAGEASETATGLMSETSTGKALEKTAKEASETIAEGGESNCKWHPFFPSIKVPIR